MNSCKILVRIKNKSQITIPNEVCRCLFIKKGDWLKVEVVNGKIVFTPQVLIDK